jgi:glucokinase
VEGSAAPPGGARAEAPPRALLGLDLGGSKVAFALVSCEGDILADARIERWTSGDPERDIERLLRSARELLAQRPVELVGGGVSAPGPLDIPGGAVLRSPNLPGWTQVPLVARLQDGLGVSFGLENDANCAALAEWRYGAGQGTRDMLFLTMSTGVGGGLILGGVLHRGHSFQAGEVGHMPVVLGGRRCHCGLRGCLEAYTGGAALAERIREEVALGVRTEIVALAGGSPEKITAEHWAQALRAGDGYALELREQFLDRLAQGLATLIAVLDPQCIVLGTIVSANPDLFLEGLRERVRRTTWRELHGVRIEPARLGERLPYYAAASAALLAHGAAPR